MPPFCESYRIDSMRLLAIPSPVITVFETLAIRKNISKKELCLYFNLNSYTILASFSFEFRTNFKYLLINLNIKRFKFEF